MKKNVVEKILENRENNTLLGRSVVFSPINIALIKYWGKRNTELNLPQTSSLSITIGEKGAFVDLMLRQLDSDEIYINGEILDKKSKPYIDIVEFLRLFKNDKQNNFLIKIDTNIPVAAGLASSAAIYSGLVCALNNLYNWQLDKRELSILARLGSGSASRSVWKGFVKWKKGEQVDGMDSYGVSIPVAFPELRVGFLLLNSERKKISSRDAMKNTVESSPLYKKWPKQVEQGLEKLEQAIFKHDFTLLGKTAEENSIVMHGTMAAANPAINYSSPITTEIKNRIKELRNSGLEIYFTQDAGPNLKLLFLAKDNVQVLQHFPEIEIIAPFPSPNKEQVILVDKNDRSIGIAEKMATHKHGGQLHRAFSVLIFRRKNDKTEVLLQQRNGDKYHCGSLWANTCCSHPRPGEDVLTAAHRRLREEMGFDTSLYLTSSFIYRAEFSNGLVEHELDHVLIGATDLTQFEINRNEVQDYMWMELSALKKDLASNSEKYVPWLINVIKIGTDSGVINNIFPNGI